MSVVDEALTELLTGRPPSDIRGLAAVYSPVPRRQNAAMARTLAGLPETGRLPAKGTAERRRYDDYLRSLQRYRAPVGRQRRRPNPSVLERLRAEARRRLTARNVARARAEGLKMRVRVGYVFYEGGRRRVSDMPGTSGWVEIPPDERLAEVLDVWVAGEREEAGELLLATFFVEYKLPALNEEEAEVEVYDAEVRWNDDAATWRK